MLPMKLRALLRKLTISVGALVAFVVAAELVARWAEPGPMSLWDRSPYLEDARLSYVHRPGFSGRWDSTWYEIDSHGWRGPEREPTFAEDELRVVALGDSCTFGKGVVEADTWPRQLEAMLRERLGPGVRPLVFNLGVNGYSMWQYERVLEQAASLLRPHLVVVGYNVNDYDSVANRADKLVFAPQVPKKERKQEPAEPSQPREGQAPAQGAGSSGAADASRRPATPPVAQDAGPTLRSRLRALLPRSLRDELNRSALYRFLRASYYEWGRERDYERIAAIVDQLSSQDEAQRERALQHESGFFGGLVESARASGARVAIFLFPFESMVVVEGFDREPERFVRDLAARHEVAFVDVPEAFRAELAARGGDQRLFIRGDRYHPNPRGYEVVARTLLERLAELGYLEPRQ
jgi:lysophospholipase L1-like esterase